MAKKTLKNTKKKTKPAYDAELDTLASNMIEHIENINKRIDRIVDAHDKCKILKGL